MFTTYDAAADARDAELNRNPQAHAGEILPSKTGRGWSVRMVMTGGMEYTLTA